MPAREGECAEPALAPDATAREVVRAHVDAAPQPRDAGLVGRVVVRRVLQADRLGGPLLGGRNSSAGATNSPMPPGKYALPVNSVMTSAAARLKVLCPDTKPGNAGVTKVFLW